VKSQKTPTAGDLATFAKANSDFGFEMQVLSSLTAEGFSCVHSGTYIDPVTGKIRQFDIRANLDYGDCTLALAVECKSLTSTSPLLVSAVPRIEPEAFNDLLVCRAYNTFTTFLVETVAGYDSTYKPKGMVGKQTDQVRWDSSEKELVSNDEATFEKLNQAVNSCQDILSKLASKATQPMRRAIVPVLVVPTGLLWQVDYDPQGAITAPPHITSRANVFLNHTWSTRSIYGDEIRYRISHIEIATFDALKGISDAWLGPDGFFPHS
jgi:hypothetical protein